MQKTYILLGAGPGIGLSTARRFAAEGFRVVLVARNAQSLTNMAQDLRRQEHAQVEVEVVNLMDVTAVTATLERYAVDLEVLHYNAAAVRQQDFSQQSSQSIAKDVSVGLTGALVAMHLAAAEMSRRNHGTILVTGGGLALHPSADYLTLGACKAALRNAVQAMSQSAAYKGLNVATLTISQTILAGSEEANTVASLFWDIYDAPESQWTWERMF